MFANYYGRNSFDMREKWHQNGFIYYAVRKLKQTIICILL